MQPWQYVAFGLAVAAIVAIVWFIRAVMRK